MEFELSRNENQQKKGFRKGKHNIFRDRLGTTALDLIKERIQLDYKEIYCK